VPGLVAVDLFRSVRTVSFGVGIAHFAHVGGALFGFFNQLVLEEKSV
jgi:membrane associated rhomboid family serine protease